MHPYFFAANLRCSVFAKRESVPLRLSSLSMAECKVRSGVAPPGLVHSPLAAIASIISLVVIGSPESASTFAAASSALGGCESIVTNSGWLVSTVC